MMLSSIKSRIALRSVQLGLLIFLLSSGLYHLIRPHGAVTALVIAFLFFMAGLFVSVYIVSALELWILKKLATGSGRRENDGWIDLPSDKPLPDEAAEVRSVMNSLKSKMEEAMTSQRRFLADASHEMRSPITIMKGNIEIALRRERHVDEYKGVLASNLEEIDRLEYLLKDLMFLARTDASELLMNFGPVSLGEVLWSVCDILKPVSVRKKIKLELQLPEAEESIIEGDPDRLKQLFINFIENALRYTPEGGKVDVEMSKVAGIVKVTVADTGIGIPEAELPKIFERFYRVDKARARESGGTGLGLCICKWIVDAHGGEISMESKEGAGTKVTVMFLSSGT